MLTIESLLCRINVRLSFAAMTLLLLFGLPSEKMEAQRLALQSRTFGDSSAMVDAGPVPVSQPLNLTLRLAPGTERSAALDQLLAAQISSSSKSYHKWLTPEQFAASYGATDDQIAAATSWLQSQGLTVGAVSVAKTRLSVTGTAAQVQRAFAVSLRRYQIAGAVYFASSTQPSLPQDVAPMIAGVSGLDDMPAASSSALARLASAGQIAKNSANNSDSLDSLGTAIDLNASPVLTLNTMVCSSELAQSDYDAYRDLFHQANAQGITVIASNGCGTSGAESFPASLTEVTAVAVGSDTNSFVAVDPRPLWQSAPGLPDDGNRDEPDLATSSVAAFAQAMTTIVQQNGVRQGNVNAILYSLATTPDLYAQPDDAPAGTWETATGLGVVNLQKLIKVFPRDTGISTTTSLSYSGSSPIGYGTQVVLTVAVAPTTAAAAGSNVPGPTGTVTFTSASQGTIGSIPLANGSATLTLSALPVGSYTITASYSGDGNYAASTSPVPVSITVTIVNASLMATISPSSNVPYGSTGTVTATVVLPNSSGAPSGTVSATIEAVTGALYTATLSPNPGGNSATANIVVAAPAPNPKKGYTVEVACQGNTNFQCQTPVDLTMTTVLGNTLTTLSVNPAAPQAGQPVTLTATINNGGNATGTYTFSGNVTFYDNGVILATAPVATNLASISKTLSGNIQHSIVAKYSGDANWNGSTSAALAVAPTLLPSSLTLTANTYNTLAGVNIVFTATAFTSVANTVGPTGTVTLYDTFNGSVVQLGSPTLISNGPNQSIAMFSTTGLLAGTHSIYAVYNGDSNFNDATSSTMSLNLEDYNLTLVPQTLTLSPGQTGQTVMLVGMIGGFNGTVSFGCTPPSNSEITCSFNPVTLTGGGSTTMSIVTTAPQYSTTQTSRREGLTLAGGASGAALLCFIMPGRRRRIPTLLVVFAVGLTANLGCGKGTSGSASGLPAQTLTDPGTPLGTQIFTITTAGSDGVNTVRHSYQYQLTVQ